MIFAENNTQTKFLPGYRSLQKRLDVKSASHNQLRQICSQAEFGQPLSGPSHMQDLLHSPTSILKADSGSNSSLIQFGVQRTSFQHDDLENLPQVFINDQSERNDPVASGEREQKLQNRLIRQASSAAVIVPEPVTQPRKTRQQRNKTQKLANTTQAQNRLSDSFSVTNQRQFMIRLRVQHQLQNAKRFQFEFEKSDQLAKTGNQGGKTQLGANILRKEKSSKSKRKNREKSRVPKQNQTMHNQPPQSQHDAHTEMSPQMKVEYASLKNSKPASNVMYQSSQGHPRNSSSQSPDMTVTGEKSFFNSHSHQHQVIQPIGQQGGIINIQQMSQNERSQLSSEDSVRHRLTPMHQMLARNQKYVLLSSHQAHQKCDFDPQYARQLHFSNLQHFTTKQPRVIQFQQTNPPNKRQVLMHGRPHSSSGPGNQGYPQGNYQIVNKWTKQFQADQKLMRNSISYHSHASQAQQPSLTQPSRGFVASLQH